MAKTGPFSVMVVDDAETNIDILVETLGDDYDVSAALDGESALEDIAVHPPDLILLDIMMPGIDGYEVCRRLKSNPQTQEIPVIFLSALNDTRDKVRGLDLGAVDYIAKPFQVEEVSARVNTHLTIYQLKQELAHELQVVAEVQKSLLPKTLPSIEGLQLCAYYQTSRYAGGDYYDIVTLPDGQWGFLVADAVGHSAPAAVRMAMTCTLFRSFPGHFDQPGQVLTYINTHLCRMITDGSFVTALYGVYCVRSRSFRFATAGHPVPLVFRSEGREAMEFNCDGVFPMGIESYSDVPEAEITFKAGDRWMIYTDGITERFNAKGEMYGEERLLRQFGSNCEYNPQQLRDLIVADIVRFGGRQPEQDDQALLIGIVG